MYRAQCPAVGWLEGDVPLYEITGPGLTRHEAADYAALGLYERADLQRLLRDDIGVLGDDLLVVAEEFGQWEDARRCIDLLALDRSGRLVVIEIKRTDDGGHMELQALRYAAMVSSMGFEEVVTAYAAHLAKHGEAEPVDARTALLSWLDHDGGDEPVVSSDARVVLVSGDFGLELTTTVLWLNRFEGLDIRCVRLVPYRIRERILLDVQQAVPLPEAADYQIRLRRKAQQQERSRTTGANWDYTRFHVVVGDTDLPADNKRQTMRVMVQQLVDHGAPAEAVAQQLGRKARCVEGRFDEPVALLKAMRRQDPDIDPTRWFLDHPIRQDDRTWVVSNQWGVDTEPTLDALVRRFADTGVSYRPADG